MSNRIAELDEAVRLLRETRDLEKSDQPVAFSHTRGKRKRTVSLSRAVAPPVATVILPPAGRRARAFTAPVDYTIPGPMDVIAQPSPNGCWATVFTMLYGWKRLQSMAIETALANVGQRWVDMFRADTGLTADDKVAFLAEAGLIAQPPMSFSVEGWERMLRDHGPIWVTTDEDPGPRFSIHARIITAIRGDGTPAGTRLHIIDPAGGREYDETIAAFIPKFQEEVRATGRIRIQVVHWPSNARASGAQSLAAARAFAAAVVPGAQARTLEATETLEQTKARLTASGVDPAEIDAFLSAIGMGPGGSVAAALTAPAGRRVTLPPASVLSGWRSEVLLAAITTASPAFGVLIRTARMVANRYNVTVGMGPAVTAGLVVGGGLGAGLVLAPGNRVGVYGTASGVLGAIVSISLTFQLTVVHGGPEVFGGSAIAAGATVDTGIGPAIGAHALFSMDGRYIGITGEVGISAGLSPFEAFVQYQRTGVVMANALMAVPIGSDAYGPATFALVEAYTDIPLDPGAGGMSLHPQALEPGDIILSTTSATVSRAIRTATGSQISHAALYVGNGEIVEADGSGVQVKTLEHALADDTVAVAFRFPGITPEQGRRVAEFAREQAQRGVRFDYWGIVRQAPFQLASVVCRRLSGAARERCEGWSGRVFLGTDSNDTFFCSELVVAAYQAAGVPITTTAPQWTSPESLAELRLTNRLGYLGHLKTP